MGKTYEDKRRLFFAKNISLYGAEEAIRHKEIASRQPSEDTTRRREIQIIITKMVMQKKKKEEIIEELMKHPEFEKYQQYFDNWVSYKIPKEDNRGER